MWRKLFDYIFLHVNVIDDDAYDNEYGHDDYDDDADDDDDDDDDPDTSNKLRIQQHKERHFLLPGELFIIIMDICIIYADDE